MNNANHDYDLERWLDDALAQYAAGEPRSGLEDRVLARVTAQESRKRNLGWRDVVVVASAAILAFVTFWAGRYQPNPVAEKSTAVEAPIQSANVIPEIPARSLGHTPGSRRPNRNVIRRTVSTPKLDQFPSAQPLNDQEKMLARFVQQFPRKAALIARAQTDLHQLNATEMAAALPRKDQSSPQLHE